MATLLLLNSCCYLLDHPDHRRGNSASVLLRTQRLFAPGVAAKGASLVYEQHGAGWATPCPWLESLWRAVHTLLPSVVQEA